MKHRMKAFLSLILCLSLCLNMVLPALAADESNSLGIGFSASLDQPELSVSTEDQTVTMTVGSDAAMNLEGIGGTILWDSPLVLTSLVNSDERVDFGSSVNLEKGILRWDGTDELEQLSGMTNVAVATFTVPANTPAGDYELGMKDIELSRNYGDTWESGASASVTLSIKEADSEGGEGEGEGGEGGETTPSEGYSASLTTLSSSPRVDDKILVNVIVNHQEDEVFAAGELSLRYDETMLAFDKEATQLSAAITCENGLLKLADYGENKAFGDSGYSYSLVFTALQNGETQLELEKAAFTNREDAESKDLSPATLGEALNVTIGKRLFAVTLDSIFRGEASVEEGDSYTFSKENEHYNYSVSATMKGEAVEVQENADGSWTIQNVSGPLTISGSRSPKTFEVRFDGETKDNDGDSATYGVDYRFSLKDDVPAALLSDGISYVLDHIKIGGVLYTGYSAVDRAYTIPGSAITGDIEILISAANIPASHHPVEVEGSGLGDAVNFETSVKKDDSYSLKLTMESGYKYFVSATMNGIAVPAENIIDNGDGTWTILNVTGPLKITVTKVLDTDSVTLTKYLSLDGKELYLIRKRTILAEGKVPTYEGQTMFWSSRYNSESVEGVPQTDGAYCYLLLVEAGTDLAQLLEEVKSKISVVEGEAVSADSMDVNRSASVDASDAQLVYNIYNAEYSDFTQLSMEKFLCADTNGSGHVETGDAVAIINQILGLEDPQ